MQRRKGREELSVVQAVDHLSSMAEIDLYAPVRLEKMKGLSDSEIKKQMQTLTWQDPEYFLYHRDQVKKTFETILNYLKDLHQKDKGKLRDEQVQKGIQAVIILATEAAEKLDQYAKSFKGAEGSITELKEYQDLMKFYHNKAFHRFQAHAEPVGEWQDQWGISAEEDLITSQKKGLKSLDVIRSDREYELFYIRKEDGNPYFNRSLLRHLQLVGKFDTLMIDPKSDDLFVRLKIMHDRDSHYAAQKILESVWEKIEEYFKESMKYKQIKCVAALNKAIMALMLSANTVNLLQNTTGKNSLKYYGDFLLYMREALHSDEYQRYLSQPPKASDRFFSLLFKLTHQLSALVFLRSGYQKEMMVFIRQLMERGSQGAVTEKEKKSPVASWNILRDEDASLRSLLQRYPNGPLLKTLSLFQKDVQMSGFDPIAATHLPAQLYTLVSNDLHVSCLRIPSPLFQKFIRKAEVTQEFYGFLRSLGSKGSDQHHLMINLQDRTSWKEHARSVALEEIPQREEFSELLSVVTLPKAGDFYWQSASYADLDDAADFIKQFKEQVAGGEQSGFYFPKAVKKKEIAIFSEKAMETIHSLFFADKKILTHRNRLDFIEIFYLLLTLKLIEEFSPDTISFTCKDALDTGTAHSAEVFAFLRILNDSSPCTKEERDFFVWMLYAPALQNRFRAIDPKSLDRMLGALSVLQGEIEAHRDAVVSGCSQLYKQQFFKDLVIKDLS